jgi:putative nucleotide binding protein
MKSEKKETTAVVLDILLKGYASDPRPVYKREPIIQAVGVDQFKLLELIPKVSSIAVYEKVYIGDDERDKIERVKRRISYSDLTHTARLELPFVVENIVKENEPRFVQFFNKSISITPKLHMLHLLPGIGKKLMWEILEEREKKPFESFEDIRQRIKAITRPEKMIISRILQELEEPEIKYRVFTTK